MKKQIKSMIFTFISLFIIALLLVTHVPNQYESYTLTIESINSDYILAYFPVDKTYTKSQITPIYNSNGDLLNISDIKVGDNIFVYSDDNNRIQSSIVKEIDNYSNTFTIKSFFDNIYYSFSIQEAENAKITDNYNNEISIDDLNVGDTISLINKKDISSNQLDNNFEEIKSIRVLHNSAK